MQRTRRWTVVTATMRIRRVVAVVEVAAVAVDIAPVVAVAVVVTAVGGAERHVDSMEGGDLKPWDGIEHFGAVES